MKQIATLTAGATLMALPAIVAAQDAAATSLARGQAIVSFIHGVLLPFVLGVTVLVFVWGVFRYLAANDEEPTYEYVRTQAAQLLRQAGIGLVLIIICWVLIGWLAGTIGY